MNREAAKDAKKKSAAAELTTNLIRAGRRYFEKSGAEASVFIFFAPFAPSRLI
jgi:hypothetical protein